MKKIGVVGIVITQKNKEEILAMQAVLGEFSDIIVGRMGIPREDVNAIALIVEGTVERISALTGKLGKFENISVKSALAVTME
ncbi:MAG: CopG family transcriptional regulator [Clostridia bacterium]|nr:CopG family transcriptional regulator [Clostridia bacterium]